MPVDRRRGDARDAQPAVARAAVDRLQLHAAAELGQVPGRPAQHFLDRVALILEETEGERA